MPAENGRADLAVVVPKNPSKAEIEAARMIAENIAKSARSGRVRITPSPDAFRGSKRIFILKNPGAEKLSPASPAPPRKSAEIEMSIGRTEARIFYSASPQAAAAAFLGMAGFRFFAPGELGAERPSGAEIAIPAGRKTSKPLMASSHIYLGGRTPEEERLLLLNGETRALGGFSHNLSGVFDADAFKIHPEFRPAADGADAKRAQPNFSAPGAAEFAAGRASEFFAKNPGAPLFSISINDSSNFDARTPQNPPPRDFFRGYPSYSDAYFAFASETARLASARHPDKFVSALAYRSTELPPSGKVAPGLLPFLTSDRMNFFDGAFRAEDAELARAWGESGAKMWGIYSYIYGAPYDVPRPIGEYEFEAVKTGAENGAAAYFAEALPRWGYDAGKIWVLMRLLGGDERGFGELEGEFYSYYYKESAEPVRDFFRAAKSAWAARGEEPRWLGFYRRDTVAELFPETVTAEMECALAAAERAASHPETARRVFELRLEFEVSKALSRHYFAQKAVFSAPESRDPDEAARLISEARRREAEYSTMRKVREAFSAYPVPNFPWKKSFHPAEDSAALSALPRLSESGRARLAEAVGAERLSILEKFLKGSQTLFFTDFSEAVPDAGRFPAGFSSRLSPDRGCVFGVVADGDGKACAAIKNVGGAEFSRAVRASPGDVLGAEMDAEFMVAPSSAAYISLAFADASGKVISRRTVSLPPFGKPRRAKITIVEKAPPGARFAAFGAVASQLKGGEFARVHSMRISKAAEGCRNAGRANSEAEGAH